MFYKCYITTFSHFKITGRLIAGWDADQPFQGKLTVRLRGDHSSPSFTQASVPLGAKFIGKKFSISLCPIMVHLCLASFTQASVPLGDKYYR